MRLAYSSRLSLELIILGFVVIVLTALKVYNLNYNSPSYTEAAFIVLGRMGIFKNDWFTYNPDVWLGLKSTIYPAIAGITSVGLGVAGTRLFNIFLSIGLLEIIYAITNFLDASKKSFVAGMTAVFLFAASAPLYYATRLGIYTIPSLFCLFLSLFLILKTVNSSHAGKYYFLSLMLLSTAVLIRNNCIVYLPILFAISIIRAKRLALIFYWKRYFLLPLLILLSLAFLAIPNIFLPRFDVELASWDIAPDILSVFAVTAIGIGLGTAKILRSASFKKMRLVFLALLFLLCGIYVIDSFTYSQKYNTTWANTDEAAEFLKANVTKQDRILTENGPITILAVFDQVSPMNITTFDWFSYSDKTGVEAYTNALKDGYFNLIQIDNEEDDTSYHTQIEQIIKQQNDYSIVYDSEQLSIYKREY